MDEPPFITVKVWLDGSVLVESADGAATQDIQRVLRIAHEHLEGSRPRNPQSRAGLEGAS